MLMINSPNNLTSKYQMKNSQNNLSKQLRLRDLSIS